MMQNIPLNYVPHYGFPVTENPEHFFPDEECCTPGEIKNHADDLERVRAGEPIEHPRAGTGWFKINGEVGHIDTTRWDIGTSWLPPDEPS